MYVVLDVIMYCLQDIYYVDVSSVEASDTKNGRNTVLNRIAGNLSQTYFQISD